METAEIEDARPSLSQSVTRKEMLDKSLEAENNQLLVKMMKSPHIETILQVRAVQPSFFLSK